jgi:CheY-like chemotaxis protein
LRNGREALETLQDSPDLILLDLKMPELDGMEFLAGKEHATVADKPVFVISASDTSNVSLPHFRSQHTL